MLLDLISPLPLGETPKYGLAVFLGSPMTNNLKTKQVYIPSYQCCETSHYHLGSLIHSGRCSIKMGVPGIVERFIPFRSIQYSFYSFSYFLVSLTHQQDSI